MLAHHFRNRETFKAYQYLVNTPEFYSRICQEIDMYPNKLEKVEGAIFDLVQSIILSVESGAGSNAAFNMYESIGDFSLICYDDILTAFTEETEEV